MNISKEIVMMPIGKVKPYIRNPRKNDKTVQLLVDIIPKVGFNVPLVIDKNGVIVKGHARFTAAIRLGMTEVPCIVTDADEEAIKLDRIADNKISEFSEWITDDLLHEVDALNIDFDLESLGLPSMSFDDFELEELPEDEPEEDEEARRERFKKYLDGHQSPAVQITSEKELKKAEAEQAELGKSKDKYYRIICEHCGHVMYIKEGEAMDI